jgi:O-antigen ligase
MAFLPDSSVLAICRRPFLDGFWLLFSTLLAAGLLFAKALNLAWILMAVTALVVGTISRRGQRRQVLSAKEGAVIAGLAGAAFLTLVLKLLPQIYWGVAGRKVSFELNALAAVGVAWCLSVRAGQRVRLSWLISVGLCTVAVWALPAAYEGVLRDGPLPTQGVNLAASMGLLLCVVLGTVVRRDAPMIDRGWALAAVLALVAVIVVSGRRGAYLTVLWTLGVLVTCAWGGLRASGRRVGPVLAAGVVTVALVTAAAGTTGWLQEPVNRLFRAANETQQSLQGTGEHPKAVGSVGIRLYLASLGLHAVWASPWSGIGPAGHEAVLQSAASQTDGYKFHFHNEYLDGWVKYGVLGLLSTLVMPLALLGAAWYLRSAHANRALVLAGLGLTHMVGGLSNVNTFHNYYQTMFALCLVLGLLAEPVRADREALDPLPA